MAAVSVFGFFALFWLAIMVGLIILSGFGLYRMAQHAGVPSPWMAFVPVASSYLTGLLAERAYYTYNRQPRSLAKWLVILNLIPLVGAPVFGLAFLTGFGGVGASWTPILPLLLLVALPGLLATALLIYCQYYIFRDYTPDNAVLYTILGLLFGISFVFFSGGDEHRPRVGDRLWGLSLRPPQVRQVAPLEPDAAPAVRPRKLAAPGRRAGDNGAPGLLPELTAERGTWIASWFGKSDNNRG